MHTLVSLGINLKVNCNMENSKKSNYIENFKQDIFITSRKCARLVDF